MPTRTASITTTGSSAATAPFIVISADRAATETRVSATSRQRLFPVRAARIWPALAVTPVTSRPALTTNSAATKPTTGSPKPEKIWAGVSTPMPTRASAEPRATASTGRRFSENSTTTAASTSSTREESLISR
ncbi:hypothetical protein OG599_01965 [Streptomyces sp. NBC_01335]|nr:hypothetical protein OG599_01965 [Streptomyces sp. NBC_01335]